jgi:hypothetical protein
MAHHLKAATLTFVYSKIHPSEGEPKHDSPFLNFLKVWDDLLLEEIHIHSTGPPATLTALYTNVESPTAKPPSSTPSRPPNGGNGGIGVNWTKYNNKNRNSGNDDGNNGKNSNGSGDRCGSSGQTTAPLVPPAGPMHHD